MKLLVKELIVKYNNTIIGYLKQLDNLKIGFQYDKEWIQTGFCISPFSLPLNSKVYISDSFDFDGLFGVFFESLPSGWGKRVISLALAKQKIDYQKLTPLTKLALVSKNGLGGLSYYPSLAKLDKTKDIDIDKIQEEINSILTRSSIKENIDNIANLAASSGGSRPKVHIKLNNDYYIVKFKDTSDPSNMGIIEACANSLAKQCGICVNEYTLIKSNKYQDYFAAKRFDILKDKKVHVISLSAILEQSIKYANLDYMHLAQVINAISINPLQDLHEAYKRMCFNVLFENKDDHGRNFAFIYDEKAKGYKLSPAFDITPTPNKSEHELAINGKGNPTIDDLIDVAKQFSLNKSKAKDIIDNIKKVLNR